MGRRQDDTPAQQKGLFPNRKQPFLLMSSWLQELWFSRVRWQMVSTEKLKASAKAIDSHSDCLTAMAMMNISRQKMETTTVRAFFSEKYFFMMADFTRGSTPQRYEGQRLSTHRLSAKRAK